MAAIGAVPRVRAQGTVVAAALVGLGAVVWLAASAGGPRVGLAALIGFGGGVALYHASFGFTAAWRRMITQGRSLGIRAQIVMLGAAIAVFYPLLARGSSFGIPLAGFVSPVGLALCAGALLFGVGMQLGGGCGSGTLYTAGGGSPRMMATLAAFIAGSAAATANPLGWMQWPDIGAYSIVAIAGGWGSLAITLPALAAVYWGVALVERARHGEAQPLWVIKRGDMLHGPWPLLAGAAALALVNIANLLVLGRPWGITSAFALWGAKAAALAGVDVAHWPYWRDDPSLGASLFADATSAMNFGLMLGALAAAGLAHRFQPIWKIPARSLAAALLGGLAMGIGARLSTGCNIGAFFSGMASGSLHGLMWIVFAIPGNALGARLRPWFGMEM